MKAFGDWAPPIPAWGAYSAPQTPLLDLRGRLAAAKDTVGTKGRAGKGHKGENGSTPPPIPGSAIET